jgi:hypothetical protein
MLCVFLESFWWSLTTAIAILILWILLLVTYIKRRNVNGRLWELSLVDFLDSSSCIFLVFQAGYVVLNPTIGLSLEV